MFNNTIMYNDINVLAAILTAILYFHFFVFLPFCLCFQFKFQPNRLLNDGDIAN